MREIGLDYHNLPFTIFPQNALGPGIERIYHMSTDHVAVGQAYYSLSRIRLDTLFVTQTVICNCFDLVSLSLSLSLLLHHARVSSQPHLPREMGKKEVMMYSSVSTSKS